MAETYIVFNDQLELYGERYITKTAPIPPGENPSIEFQKRKILAILFEQFLLFDKIAIKIDKDNLALYFLIKELGFNKVEELLYHNVIVPVLWTPIIMTSLGNELPDGTYDESSVIGQAPIISGFLSGEESTPEYNIDRLLSYFNIHPDRKKRFKKKVLSKYILPDNSIAQKSASIVIDAYLNNRLAVLGLKADKDPEKLNFAERDKIFQLGNEVLETTVLAQNKYLSYDKYSNFSLTKESVRQIETGYHVSENTSQILKIESLANLQTYFLEYKIPFERVFDIRYKNNIKHYRKWINSLSVSTDTAFITKEYIDEVAGKNKFFESDGGKLIRTVGMFSIGTGIVALIGGPGGASANVILGKVAGLGLAMLDTYVLDGILKGWNPKMFVDEIKLEVQEEQKLEDK